MNYTQLIKAALAKQKAIMNTAKEGSRKLTPEEQSEFDNLQADIDGWNEMAENEKKLEATNTLTATPAPDTEPPAVVPVNTENDWKETQFGEFIHACAFNKADNRLTPASMNVKNEGSAGTGSEGGFAIPSIFQPRIRMIEPGAAQIRPRCEIIPADSGSPDAEVKMPAMDQTGTKGVYGGVTVVWGTEGYTRSETDVNLKEVILKTNEVGAYILTTNKLLRNAVVMGPFYEKQLRGAVTNSEEYQFLRGDGIGKPIGIIGHPAAINITRNTASQILYADIIGMFAQALMDGGRYIWMASQTAIPQLMAMVDAGNNLVWQPNAREGAPDSLLGIPILYNTNSPSLGSQGDLVLVNWDKYLIKDGVGMSIMINPYLNSRSQKTDIQINFSVDGQPWLTEPIMLEDATTTVSPFIVLE